jgi:hypothetical protein
MSKNNKNIFYKTLVMSNDINSEEGIHPMQPSLKPHSKRLARLA